MRPFTRLQGLLVPLDRPNVDTDAIIPKQFLKSIQRSGFGPYLFDTWRYLDHGEPGQDCCARTVNPDFVLNAPRYRDAEILLARVNFGCGSSREHAVWALHDYGIRCIIAPSYAEIFQSNCFKNGVLPIVLDEAVIEALFLAVAAQPGYRLMVDLPLQTVTTPAGHALHFDVGPGLKQRLLEGLDDIDLSLRSADAIRRYEERRRVSAPWLFLNES
ncbi:MAG: 3-isopropylmalate dehydratase small subunit [Gammaproteobacteria bacterium]